MEQDRILILGAGIAGAATAWHLLQAGALNVLVVEKELVGDQHSTGRNAAILRTALSDPALHALARESLAFFQSPPPGFSPTPLLNPLGLVLATGARGEQGMNSWITSSECATGAQTLTPNALHQLLPALGHSPASAWLFDEEGTLDLAAIHQGFLGGARRAGAEVQFDVEVECLWVEAGQLRGVHTSRGTLEANVVVMAAGGWAETLAATAGLGLPLTPMRRHLLVTAPLPQVDPSWPVFWATEPDFYCRPESGGLLLCGCDDKIVHPDQGETTEDAVLETLLSRTKHWMPEFAHAEALSWWAGVRTFAPDQRFVLGADSRLPGLHWAAGLGGHGITCSPAVGRIVAEGVLLGTPAPSALTPDRLVAELV